MNSARIRPARQGDAAAIARIYAPYVEHTAISFETAAPDRQVMKERIKAVSEHYPYLVCEADGVVAAYAYAARHMERAAYQWNAEISFYVDSAFHRRGFGAALAGAVMDVLGLQRIRNVYGIVALPNPGSEGLLRRLGFQLLGVLPKTGYKFGQWHDVGFFGTAVAPDHPDPPEPIPASRIDEAALKGIYAARAATLGQCRALKIR